MPEVLSIETGYSCNALCGFCPQLRYRGELEPSFPLDLTTEQIRERIRWGAERGAKHLGFSGGEPTIRDDFIDLVRYGKDLGYERIAVTTNGMMLGYKGYARRIVEAGLDTVNVSIHGPDAKSHNAMMRAPYSFEMAMRGLDNLQHLRERKGRRIDVMQMSLASPQVLEHFPEIVRITGEKGARQHMIQPFTFSKGNTHLAHLYLASYEQIAEAIREASAVAERHGGHVKLFNTPVCLLWDIEDRLERQWKKLSVFREFENDDAGELHLDVQQQQRETPGGFFRIQDCKTCPEPCNGFRAEYYPQDRMLEEMDAAVAEHVAAHGTRELWFGGIETLAPDRLDALLGRIRDRGVERLTVFTAAIGRTYHEQYDIFARRGVDEVCFVAYPPKAMSDNGDRHQSHGNEEDLAYGLRKLRRASGVGGPQVSLMMQIREPRVHEDLLERFVEAGVGRLWLYGSVSHEGGESRHLQDLDAGEQAEVERVKAAMEPRGVEVRVAGRSGTSKPWSVPVVDPKPRFVRHRWASREMSWIAWSAPLWARVGPQTVRHAEDPTVPG
ncbi:MAG: radical SAM protein [Myxococcota bacterium]